MVNLASASARAGRVCVHRYPDAVAFYKNVLSTPETDSWVVVLRVGTFAARAAATAFADLWFSGTRHTDRLLRKVLTVVRNHPRELAATVTALPANEHRVRLARRKPGLPTTGAPPRYARPVPRTPASEVARREFVLAPVLARPPQTLRGLLQLVTLYDVTHRWVGARTVADVPLESCT